MRKEKIKEFRIIDVDDSDALNVVDMSGFYHRYMKWYDKRKMLREVCKSNNVRVP